MRGIPLFWRIVDALFGIVGAAPLLIVRRLMRRLRSAPGEGKMNHTGT
jgi:hypothetical protein